MLYEIENHSCRKGQTVPPSGRIDASLIMAKAFREIRSVARIQNNNGGVIADFENAGDAIHAGARQMLVIDGFCASACMVMADRARPSACITPHAQFGYHETNFDRPIPLHADLNDWIMRHGGFPSYNRMGIMPNDTAQQFWPLCSQDIIATSAAPTRMYETDHQLDRLSTVN